MAVQFIHFPSFFTFIASCCSYENGTKECTTCTVVPSLSLSVECCDILGLNPSEFCSDRRRSLKEENNGTHLTELRVEYFPGNQPLYQDIGKIIEDEERILFELGQIEENEKEIIENELKILVELEQIEEMEKEIIEKEDAIIKREVDIKYFECHGWKVGHSSSPPKH